MDKPRLLPEIKRFIGNLRNRQIHSGDKSANQEFWLYICLRMCFRCAHSFFTLFFILLLTLCKPSPARPTDADPKPEPAIPAILAAFDKYEVVAMPEDHGLKDLDDLIFGLVRNPAFPD